MTHLTFDQISELAESGAEDSHVMACAACRETLGKVRGLLSAAHALPREIAPPLEAWTAVRSRIASDARTRALRAARWWHNGWLATAAAIVLVFGTATFMALVARGKSSKAKAVMVSAPPPTVAPALLAVDKNYVATIRELRATLETQRPTLSPSTIRTVEHSLGVIDVAIAEARAALAADPANQALVDILASYYERQVDLLQRAAELSSSL